VIWTLSTAKDGTSARIFLAWAWRLTAYYTVQNSFRFGEVICVANRAVFNRDCRLLSPVYDTAQEDVRIAA